MFLVNIIWLFSPIFVLNTDVVGLSWSGHKADAGFGVKGGHGVCDNWFVIKGCKQKAHRFKMRFTWMIDMFDDWRGFTHRIGCSLCKGSPLCC